MYDLREDPDELRNAVSDARYAVATDDMRARLYELMARYHDPYGDSPERYSSTTRPDRYDARGICREAGMISMSWKKSVVDSILWVE